MNQQVEQGQSAPETDRSGKGSLVQTQIGRVGSDKMDRTVTVLVERRVKHPLYGEVVTRSNRYHVRDAKNEYREGALVELEACRKLAKTKAWRVRRLIDKAKPI